MVPVFILADLEAHEAGIALLPALGRRWGAVSRRFGHRNRGGRAAAAGRTAIIHVHLAAMGFHLLLFLGALRKHLVLEGPVGIAVRPRAGVSGRGPSQRRDQPDCSH